MILTELIRSQAFDCCIMTAAGAAVMIMYQIFRGTCGMFSIRPVITAAAEVGFWVLAAVMTSHFLYYCAYGRISFHAAAAFTAGALLWKVFFYDIIDKIYLWIYMKQRKCNNYGEKEKKQPIQREQPGDRH